ncbi:MULTISPECIES: relaxase/mobilization nuclease domain-containing protein [unclassified Shinella]|uniref:relaxase/mobilization nuclease domain-containing protein n=1 Tax=unclassified Shinella TaxID=2643062 RepID=UPI00234F7A69|nr:MULTISPECIES: relaxase/mobilization nuclease domain-containing protein [unclassified Shinella]MCO5153989.1 relaxase/mobilization nuclease domain-containing protein [Shinella sp.]MDC7266909.1 relaxase/mobilization nuclease domain-containing protein [Shinella sp. HY16]MDC7273806.1 relaxase/mobilization nuclease domain-containing protein [Shinella sp. YZ44]
MAHDWSGLLSEIEAFSARRAALLIDEEEEQRRRRASGIALSDREPARRFVPTGIAKKAAAGASIPSSEPTIASILQAPASSQQGVIALVGTLDGGGNREDEDEPRASAGGGGGGGSAATAPRAARPTAPPQAATGRASAETASRGAIAAGAQPVVVKVTSTVSSRASAAGLMTYLGTREVENENGENGKVDISIYDQDGVAISSREDRAAALAEWAADFRETYAVNALATFSMKLADEVDDAALHDALNAAFSSKPFLYSRHADGQVSVFAVTDLPAKRIAGALKAREKGEGPARAVENAEAAFARRLADAGVSAEVRVLGAAVSEKSGRYFLEKFLRTEKAITTSEGDLVKGGSSVKDRADGIWRSWSSHIRTVEPRNAFHIIFSARAGTDAEAMTRAVRDFLSEQVAGHRWITAHHPETGHVHIHAMISARDDVGKALRLTKPELYEWRERFAAKARERGIAMVATRRADVAATRPYSQAQAGAYERGRQDARYLKTPAVTNRVERKRAGVVDRVSLTNGNLALAPKWQATAIALQRAGAEPSVIAAANRFAAAASAQAPHAAARASGFVLLRLDVEQAIQCETMAVIVEGAVGVEAKLISAEGKSFQILAPTTASASKIERELAKQNDEAGPGPEMQSVVRDFQARLLGHGLRASVVIEAAGSAKHGAPSPWLQRKFDALAEQSVAPPDEPLAEFKSLIATIQQQKEKAMPLSLEQFDERVSRANKSMDRLETMVDSSAERQAVEEMRKEISALFEEQRRDIQMQQMRSVNDTAGSGDTPPAARVDEARAQDRPPPATVDPAIAAQQQAIAAGRASRAAREQAGASKAAQDEQRQQILRQAEQERQRGNDREGAER